MRAVAVALASVVAAGCVSSESVRCKNGLTCPAGAACDETHTLCVDPDQLTACNGLAQADDCTFDGTAGKCTEAVCLVPECGNTVLDIGEVCEDHNIADRDGCSSDCTSMETCGNGVTDRPVGEGCDDGNAVDNDGCTGTCEVEQAQWIDASAVQPPGRAFAVMAYDATRDSIVMIGGSGTGPDNFSGTYEWTGEWTPAPALVAPSPARRAIAAYDHAIGRVIVEGGLTANATVEGTMQTWDGTKWLQGSGPALASHGGAYDARRKRLVVFGGFRPDGESDDKTWEFDGTSWAEVSPATTRPAPRIGPAMTYDPEHAVVLMYGGLETINYTVTNELWSFDGVDWKLLSTGGPPGRYGVYFAYYVPSHAAIVFGGQDPCSVAPCPFGGDTWKVTLDTPPVWTKLTPTLTNQPSSRAFGALVADGHGRLVLFGGYDGSGYPSDTWIFEGSAPDWHEYQVLDPRNEGNAVLDVDRRRVLVYGGSTSQSTLELSDNGWTEWPTLAGTSAPNARGRPGMVYDEKNRKVVAFGGQAVDTSFPDDTWLWDGSGSGVWTQAATVTKPPGARQGQLVYDTKNQRVLLFGPHSEIAANPPNLDAKTTALWAWDGSTWTELHPAHVPPPRLRAVVGFDRARGELVLFGGGDGSAALPVGYDDTWVFDGVDWHEVIPPAGVPRPPANVIETSSVGQSLMAWNPARARLTLLDANANIWEWLGSQWEVVETSIRPPRRTGYSLVPSRDGHGLTYMFGYQNGTPTAEYAPWKLRWSASSGSESCARPVDFDGDGKTGCDDPDCWTRCMPRCPPFTTCPANAPRCGDGTCDANEDCYSCSDCTCGAVCGDFVCAPGETCPGDCP